MLFIEGIGYVNDSITTNAVNTKQAEPVSNNSFDVLLSQETEKLNNEGKTYDLNAIFKEASETYGISEDLLKAVGYVESRFNPYDTSSSGAMGIMQLMPETAASLGVTDAYDPYQNIMGAAKLLNGLSDLYDGDITLMLAAYNAGAGAVKKYGGVPPYDSVNHYISKVYDALGTGVSNEVPAVTYTKSNNAISTKQTESTAISNTESEKKEESTVSRTANPYNNTSLNNTVTEALKKTGETATTNIFDYRTGNTLNNLLSYSQYEILMDFYDHMLDIIASIGSSDNNKNDTTTDFLYGNLTYNKNTLNLFTDI